MKRFVIQCKDRGYLSSSNSKSLWYTNSDFVDTVYHAKHYKTFDGACRTGAKLLTDHNGVNYVIDVLPITIHIDIENKPHGINNQMDVKMRVAKDLVALVKEMSAEECEALSNKKWQEYLTAKRYVLHYG